MHDHTNMERELITVAVEHALLQMGTAELEMVEYQLKNDFNSTIGDCLEHPEYLKQVLKELFGYCCEDILSTVEYVVKGGNIDGQVKNFLTILNTKQLAA